MSGHFKDYGARAADIDASVVSTLWCLRCRLIELMGLGLSDSAARHVFRHAVLNLWDLRKLRKLAPERAWSSAARRSTAKDLVLDHAIPAKRLSDIVLDLERDPPHPPTPTDEAGLRTLIEALSVCFVITKAEHDLLCGKGYSATGVRGAEMDPRARYAAVGIEVEG